MPRRTANPNAMPETHRRQVVAELRSAGYRPGAADELIAWSFGCDKETAAEGTCDHCGREGLAAACYCRGKVTQRTRPEYQCLVWCPACHEAFLL